MCTVHTGWRTQKAVNSGISLLWSRRLCQCHLDAVILCYTFQTHLGLHGLENTENTSVWLSWVEQTAGTAAGCLLSCLIFMSSACVMNPGQSAGWDVIVGWRKPLRGPCQLTPGRLRGSNILQPEARPGPNSLAPPSTIPATQCPSNFKGGLWNGQISPRYKRECCGIIKKKRGTRFFYYAVHLHTLGSLCIDVLSFIVFFLCKPSIHTMDELWA